MGEGGSGGGGHLLNIQSLLDRIQQDVSCSFIWCFFLFFWIYYFPFFLFLKCRFCSFRSHFASISPPDFKGINVNNLAAGSDSLF